MSSNQFVVSELNIFPLKSAAGLGVKQMRLDKRGPQYDRRWMLINQHGEFITQRQNPRLCLIHASLDSEGQLVLNADGMAPFTLFTQDATGSRIVTVWHDCIEAEDCGDKVANWVSEFLNQTCRVVFMPEQSQRLVDPNYAKNNEIVSFSDGFPLLLISQASLDAFNSHLQSPISMIRFRPNIVVSGCEAFAEDRWQLIRIRGIEFQVAKPCSRCVIPSIDPANAMKQPDVARALAKHRRREGNVYFGQNLLHCAQGTININDPVDVLSVA